MVSHFLTFFALKGASHMRFFILLCLFFTISCGEDLPRPNRDFEGLDSSTEEDSGTLDFGQEGDFEVEVKHQSICEKYNCENLIDMVDVQNRRTDKFNFQPQPFEFDMG